LFGQNGITPAQPEEIFGKKFDEIYFSFLKNPSLLRALNYFVGLDSFSGIEVVNLLGIFLSFFR
jgi:hypothetical protein